MFFSDQFKSQRNSSEIETRLKAQIEIRRSPITTHIPLDLTKRLNREIETRNYNTDPHTYTKLFQSDSSTNPIIFNKFSNAINSAIDHIKNNNLYVLLDSYGNSFAKPDEFTTATPLQLAIINKKLIAVKIILNYLNYDLSTTDINYLAIATEISDTSIMKELLLCKGTDPNVRGGTQSQLPLYYAIVNKNLDAMDLLLDAGIKFELVLNNDLSFIEFCINNRYPDIIILKLLSNPGMILFESDLEAIFKFGGPEIVKSVLVSDIKFPECDLNKLFSMLSKRVDIDIRILVLMKDMIDSDQFDTYFLTVLLDAITNSNTDTIQYLLQNNYVDLAMISESGNNAITTAILFASDEINYMLAQHIHTNCTPNKKAKIVNHVTPSHQTPMLIISDKNNTSLFKLFYELFKDELEFDPELTFKILFHAIKNSNAEIFDICIGLINPNKTDVSGMTLAMHAVNLKKLDLAKKMINHIEFDINTLDALGKNTSLGRTNMPAALERLDSYSTRALRQP